MARRHEGAAPELPPSCPLEIWGQVAGAGSCPRVAAFDEAQTLGAASDLRVLPIVGASASGAGWGQLGGRYPSKLPHGRGQLGAARGQVNPASCPQRIAALTCTFSNLGAEGAGKSEEFDRKHFTEVDIRPHNTPRKRHFTAPQKSSRENLPLLPLVAGFGGAR